MNNIDFNNRPLYRVYQIMEPERIGERYRCVVGGCRIDLTPSDVIQLFPQLVRILELDREERAAALAEITDENDHLSTVIDEYEQQLEGD